MRNDRPIGIMNSGTADLGKSRFILPGLKWGLIVGMGVLVLAILWQATRHPTDLDAFHVRVVAVHRLADGSALLDVVITNGTSAALNIVDDSSGKPAFVLETSAGKRSMVTSMVNSLAVNLAPGVSLTNSVLLTNAPFRFRLYCIIRDLNAETGVWGFTSGWPKFLGARWVESQRHRWDLPFQYTDWVDLGAVTNNPP
jgi:hypothetical protein